MANFTLQGKIYQKAIDNGKALDLVLEEAIQGKDKIYYNYLPFNLYKSDFNKKLQETITELNVGDEIEMVAKIKGNEYNGKFYSKNEPTLIKIINKVNVSVAKTEENDDSNIPW